MKKEERETNSKENTLSNDSQSNFFYIHRNK